MRVLISGAGIAGPTLAWFLSKDGAHVDIVEKSRVLLSHGQNVDIEGSAITAIKKMGLLDEVRRLNTTEKGTQFIDPQGRPFAPFPQDGSSVSPTSELEILRGDLAKLLYEATKDFPGVNYLFDTTIKNVVSNDEKAVRVELSNGEIQDYDLLVAADGQWSRTRKQCFSLDSVTVKDIGMTAVYWTLPRVPSDNDWWNIYQGLGSRGVTVRPDPHGTLRACCTRMYCNETQKKIWLDAARSDKKSQQELMRDEFRDVGWQIQRLLDSMESSPDFYFQAVQQIRMKNWSNCRVVCLGDAAYAPTPLTGAGSTLAITGAYILAGELSKLSEGDHPSVALEAYDNTFRPHVEKIQNIPFFVPGIAHPETPFKRWLFSVFVTGISKLAAIPWLKSCMAHWVGPGEQNDNGFPLPKYPTLDRKIAASGESR